MISLGNDRASRPQTRIFCRPSTTMSSKDFLSQIRTFRVALPNKLNPDVLAYGLEPKPIFLLTGRYEIAFFVLRIYNVTCISSLPACSHQFPMWIPSHVFFVIASPVMSLSALLLWKVYSWKYRKIFVLLQAAYSPLPNALFHICNQEACHTEKENLLDVVCLSAWSVLVAKVTENTLQGTLYRREGNT